MKERVSQQQRECDVSSVWNKDKGEADALSRVGYLRLDSPGRMMGIGTGLADCLHCSRRR